MANLNLEPAEITILMTGFSVAHKMYRGGSVPVYDAISKFALAVNLHGQDKLMSLLTKMNSLLKDTLEVERIDESK